MTYSKSFEPHTHIVINYIKILLTGNVLVNVDFGNLFDLTRIRISSFDFFLHFINIHIFSTFLSLVISEKTHSRPNDTFWRLYYTVAVMLHDILYCRIEI